MRWIKIITILIGVISVLYRRFQDDGKREQEDFSEENTSNEILENDISIDQNEWIQIGKFNPFEAERIIRTLQNKDVEFRIQKMDLSSRRKIRSKIIIFILLKDQTRVLSYLGYQV